MQLSKINRRKRIHRRVRKKVSGTAQRPRLNVFRSNKFIYAQLINDVDGSTIVQASSYEAAVANEGTKSERSGNVVNMPASDATAAGIDTAVFDRSGYLYHGRVKSLADGAREGGLNL